MMVKLLNIFILQSIFFITFSHISIAQDISEVGTSANRDLLQSIDRLNIIRKDISEEKIPLAQRISRKENSILNLRNQAARVQAANDSNTLALADIRADLAELEQENNFLVSLLDEYARKFESDLSIIERDIYKKEIDAFNSLDTDAIGDDRLSTQLTIIERGFSRIRQSFDGVVFTGSAVTSDGTLKEGRIARFGPLAYYSNENDDINGLVVESNNDTAHLFIENSGFDNLPELLEGQLVSIPIDVTNGKAITVQTDKDGIMDHIQKGGVWIIPILIFASISIIASLWKIWEIYQIKSPENGRINKVLSQLNDGDKAAANNTAKSLPYPIGNMFGHAVDNIDKPKELVEEIMYENMLDTQPKLEKYLPLIAISAATAPLLGLLGTVTGMINTFQLITLFGTGDAQSLSSGISEALITTEFGLIVAIPALIMHALLSRKVKTIMTEMEKYAVIFLNAIPKKVSSI